MFVFDDLLSIDANGVKEILARADRRQLTVALKGASDEMRQHLLKGMSQRGAAMLLEDMEALGPMKISDVEAAQQTGYRGRAATGNRRRHQPQQGRRRKMSSTSRVLRPKSELRHGHAEFWWRRRAVRVTPVWAESDPCRRIYPNRKPRTPEPSRNWTGSANESSAKRISADFPKARRWARNKPAAEVAAGAGPAGARLWRNCPRFASGIRRDAEGDLLKLVDRDRAAEYCTAN